MDEILEVSDLVFLTDGQAKYARLLEEKLLEYKTTLDQRADALGVGDDADFLTKNQQKYADDLENRIESQRAELDEAESQRLDMALPEDFLSAAQRKYMSDLTASLESDQVISQKLFAPPNERFYLPRVWALDKIEGREDELKAILVAWFRENPLGDMSQEALERRAERAIDKIMKRATLEEYQLFSESSSCASVLNARGLDIPNELVADFVETDVTKLANMYGQRFGVMNEMQRAFGEVSALDSIDDVLMQSSLEIDASDLAKGLDQLDE